MLKNRNILYFADDYGRYPSTMQHIGKILLNNNRLLWVGSLGQRYPEMSWADLKRIFRKVFDLIKSRSAQPASSKNLVLFTPLIIPFHDFSVFRYINKFLLKRQLLSTLKKNNFTEFIIITSTPMVADVLGELGEKSSFYFCLDDYAFFKNAFRTLPAFENRLLEKISAVFSVSVPLMQNRVPKSAKSYFLPQGVNFSHFNDALVNKKKNTVPTIGYFGLLADYVNIPLIVKMANAYPEYNFVILGKAVVDVSLFSTVSNLKYLGEVAYSELPNLAVQFDVGLIPFYLNELTIAVNPLKLMEYFALGIPVVSVAMPEVKKFSEYAFVGETDEEQIALVEFAVKDNSAERNMLRQNVAKEFSWEGITENISRVIEELVESGR